ncbi:hypothetical protein IU500_34715, partial [Nocardia terpenica]|nr:hypothetical protein [Nocardia terpenica]MBF6109169.1 hypothetical protein [Nocardia terpenica]MBF6114629.1 hypothetical protein [Nocardia terpenica]MBF6123314.1 hypothetical protein [Nocardia terpenica]MBF6156668.1 hypothetical protein [Nocardia terpenica]
MAPKVTIDYGQADIAAFKQGALSGHIKFDPQAVDDVVRVYDVLIEGLRKEISKIQNIAVMTSFGGFPSTQPGSTGVVVSGLRVCGAQTTGCEAWGGRWSVQLFHCLSWSVR